MTVAIKFCGITRAQDAAYAASLGVAACGMIFYPPAATCVTVAQAKAICAALPPFCAGVGVFVDPEKDMVARVIDEVRLQCLQFHGAESADFCAQFSLPYIKSYRMPKQSPSETSTQLRAFAAQYSNARGILLDTYVKDVPGGSGVAFDWSQLAESGELDCPIVLAGGLRADNVRSAIDQAMPYAVDTSSGIASGDDPRVKDREKMKRFVDNVNAMGESA